MTLTEQLVVEEHCERDEWMVLDSPSEAVIQCFLRHWEALYM